jgi:hypothetical protein
MSTPASEPPGPEREDELVTDPEGEGLADDLIGDDPEPIGGWRRFNEKGERVDEKGNVIPDPEQG